MSLLNEITANFDIKTSYKVGVTDEYTECGCCGKKNLKKTVVLRDAEGQYNFYGSSCAKLAGKQGIKGKLTEAKVSFKVVHETVNGYQYRVILEEELKNLKLHIWNPQKQEWKEIEKPILEFKFNIAPHGTDRPLYNIYRRFEKLILN